MRKGEFYLHNRSGARKSSGSYFTKPFAVEHLLEHALEPALRDHLKRIEKLLDDGDEPSAGEQFFDFRCADIAMGSGHFLVAAVDRIERRFANFLAKNHIAGVFIELAQLRQAAKNSLGGLADTYDIEDSSLLRRQIARRCIYGVDLNPIAVDLARLSIWIHTFVPGLPLSFLDRTLICGDSLTGIGTLEELRDIYQPKSDTKSPADMFWQQVEDQLKLATEPLKRLAKVAESTVSQVKEAQAEYATAVEQASPVAALMDLGVAIRNGEADRPAQLNLRNIAKEPGTDRARQLAEELNAVHFPVRFPEVFVSARPGFDCIIGNPPWEKVKVEEHAFWGRHFLGHRSLSQAQQRQKVEVYRSSRPQLVIELEAEQERAEKLRTILLAGPFDLGAGDTDLYQVFAWRFWQLIADDGAIAVVLPRSALAGKGLSAWRAAVLEGGAFTDTTLILNRGYWAFDDMEARYTISLTVVRKGRRHGDTISTRGPFNSLASFKVGVATPPTKYPVGLFKEWSEDLSFPLIPTAEAGRVFLKMREHPRFDSPLHPWKARPIAEFHATNDKHLMILDPKGRKGLWPVYGGKSFNIWEPDTGRYYAWIDPDVAAEHLFEKRKGQARTRSSAFYGMPADWIDDPETLPIKHPRVAFRDVTNRTNQRTVIAALIPPHVGLNHKALYLLFSNGNPPNEGFVLGVMASIPFDWLARRLVETNVTLFLLNSLPFPKCPVGDPTRRVIERTAGRLAAVDRRYAEWAKAVGVPVGSVKSETERLELVHQLDALVAKLYGLDEADLRVIFETFHVGWDFQPRLDAVLDHFRRLK
ncbi:MAG: hypothetical protein EXQ69_10040 [Acidimicrobiia bacterium]|nr:hypothetical protein [Acidimicrobiia bacterium]